MTLAPGAHRTWHLAIAIGPRDEAMRESAALAANAQTEIARAREASERRWKQVFEKLPRLESANQRLVKFYNRSLLHFILNRWDVPEFVLKPYYSTGAVLGGCLGNYLWNFGEPWEIFPLYDAPAAKAHIKQFLSIDLTRHFLFDPISGAGDGAPLSGESGEDHSLDLLLRRAYRRQRVSRRNRGGQDGRRVGRLPRAPWRRSIETCVAHRLRQRQSSSGTTWPVSLRLHRAGPERPRYANYVLAARLAGHNHDYLLRRAEALKTLLREKLWNPRVGWYDLLTPDGRRDTRYTVQMFKLIGSPVLGKEEEAALVRHLNEKEFLSAYGLHSMSKLDPAYDQVDIDNGGGGICGSFVSQIAERLYKARRPREAEDLLSRVLWWGERVPYWGDSFVANQIDYRKDTPLQSAFDAPAAAQAVLFGMFGISVAPDGAISIDPQPPSMSPSIALRGIRLRGRVFDVVVEGNGYEVIEGTKRKRARLGTPATL